MRRMQKIPANPPKNLSCAFPSARRGLEAAGHDGLSAGLVWMRHKGGSGGYSPPQPWHSGRLQVGDSERRVVFGNCLCHLIRSANLFQMQVDAAAGLEDELLCQGRRLAGIREQLEAEQGQCQSHLYLVHSKLLPNAVPGERTKVQIEACKL